MLKNNLKTKESGFSLIEVIVTISILSLLISVAIPNYSEIKGRIYDVTLKNDIRNIKTSLSDLSANRNSDGYNYIVTNGATGFLYSFDSIKNNIDVKMFNADLNFPKPFSAMNKSYGTKFFGAYELTLNGKDYMYIYATHEKSKHSFYEYNNGEQTLYYTFENF